MSARLALIILLAALCGAGALYAWTGMMRVPESGEVPAIHLDVRTEEDRARTQHNGKEARERTDEQPSQRDKDGADRPRSSGSAAGASSPAQRPGQGGRSDPAPQVAPAPAPAPPPLPAPPPSDDDDDGGDDDADDDEDQDG